MRRPRVLIVGATGHFGGRIARRLAAGPIELGVSSRHAAEAADCADELRQSYPGSRVTGIVLDRQSEAFGRALHDWHPDVVVHTAGPYQSQDYRVARACIEAGSHYVDLADGREFVTGFATLDAAARERGVTLVTGASTLPGLSSAVVGHFSERFTDILSISMSIAPAHQTPRGQSTMRAVLSYCGKPIPILRDGRPVLVHGWQDFRRQHYPELGKRWSAACDVPDLDLLPRLYPGLRDLSFHAALEAPWEQLSLYLLAALVRLRIVSDAARWTGPFARLARPLSKLGSESGGMHIRIGGIGRDGREKNVNWHLTAHRNHGPEVPCTPAIVLVKKLALDGWRRTGAGACVQAMTLAEFDRELSAFEIGWAETET